MKSSFCSNFSGISPFLSPFGVTVTENDDEYNVVMFWKKYTYHVTIRLAAAAVVFCCIAKSNQRKNQPKYFGFGRYVHTILHVVYSSAVFSLMERPLILFFGYYRDKIIQKLRNIFLLLMLLTKFRENTFWT